MNNMMQFDGLFSLYVAKNSTFNYTCARHGGSFSHCLLHAHN